MVSLKGFLQEFLKRSKFGRPCNKRFITENLFILVKLDLLTMSMKSTILRTSVLIKFSKYYFSIRVVKKSITQIIFCLNLK